MEKWRKWDKVKKWLQWDKRIVRMFPAMSNGLLIIEAVNDSFNLRRQK